MTGSMVIGAMEIQMLADLARLRQDMDQAKSVVGGAMEQIKTMAGLAQKALGAMLGVGTAAAFAAIVKGGIDSAGALHDLSIQTGASVAALAAFKSVGSFTETSLDSISNAMGKLSKNMALADEDGKGAALAIKALGLDFDAFRRMDPDQRMLAVAAAMREYKDGADKSAAATLLFGKEGARLLPFLADLGDQADAISAKLTDQEKATRAAQAAMSDAFGDNLTQLRKNGEGWKRDLSTGLLPALYEASEALVAMGSGTNGLKAQISALSKDGTLAEWARGAMLALSYLLDVGQGLFSLLPMLGKLIAGVAAGSSTLFGGVYEAMQRIKSGDFSGAWDSLRNGFAGVQAVATSTGEDIANIWGQKLLGATFRERMGDLKGVGVQAQAAKKDLNLVEVLRANEAAKAAEAEATKRAAEEERKRAAEIEKATKAGDEMVRGIGKRNTQLEQELQLGRKLTPVEQDLLKLTTDLADGKIILSRTDEEAARKAIEYGHALEDQIKLQAEAKKATEAAQQARVKEFDSITQTIDKLRDEAEQQRAANETLLSGVDVTGSLAVAKLREAAASAERQAIVVMERQEDEALAEQFRQQAAALRGLADLKEQGIHIKAAQDARKEWEKTTDSINNGLTDALMRAFERGKGFGEAFRDTLVNAFKTMVLKPVIEWVVSPVGQLVASVKQSATNSIVGQLGNYGSVVSGVAGLWGAGSTAGAGTGTLAYANAVGAAGGDSLGALIAANGSWAGVGTGSGAAAGGGAAAAGGSGSSLATLGWIGAAIAGAFKANSDYNAGYDSGFSINRQNSMFGGNFGQWSPEGAKASFLSSLGFNDKWASLLSGSTAFGKITDLLGIGGGTMHQGSVVGITGPTTARTLMGDDSRITDHLNANTDTALRALGGTSVGVVGALDKAFGGAGLFNAVAKFASDGRDPSIGEYRLRRGDTVGAGAQLGYVGNNGDFAKYASNNAEGFQQYAQDVARATRQALDNLGLPQWVRDQLKVLGESASLTDIAKLVDSIVAVQNALRGMQDELAPLGGVFSRVAGLSGDALKQLVDFAGGIDALRSSVGSYVKSYYSEGEQAAIGAAALRKQLGAAGVNADMLRSKEDFRALVDGTDVGSEAGRKQLVALLDAAQGFAQISDYLGKTGGTLGDLAGRAPTRGVLGSLNDGTATGSDVQTSGQLLQTANAQLGSVAANTANTATQLQQLVQVQATANEALLARLASLEQALADAARMNDLANNGNP